MTFLLDTHALIWMMEGDSRLSQTVSDIILNEENELWVSSISFWEISIKRSLGKLHLQHSSSHFWESTIKQGIHVLNISPDHLQQLEALPFHHKDPFDRMLVSQAQIEEMTLLTKDKKFAAYDVPVIWENS